ncbi:UNVERIFIED_ORG: hypothetical protein ABIB52_000674 [Arthrobacter sp. UYCu721]
MRTFFYRNALILLLAGVFVAVGISYAVVTNTQHTQVVTQEQEISELDAQMKTELATARADQQAVVDSALGTNAQRITADTELIRQFVKTAVTWKSGEEYTAARDSLKRKYKLDEDSQFMKVYFQEPVFNTDTSGNRFYVVDTEGLNSNLSSVDVKALGVAGTAYRYMVLADIGSASNDGKASATKTSVIYLTLDGEGQMADVSGFASVSKALTSK